MRNYGNYTKAELDRIKEEILKGFSQSQTARNLAKELNRPYSGLVYKIGRLTKETSLTRQYNKKSQSSVIPITGPKATSLKLTLPEGMTYEGTAKRVELHSDHFRIYF